MPTRMSQSGIIGNARGKVGTRRFHLRPDWEGTRAFSCNRTHRFLESQEEENRQTGRRRWIFAVSAQGCVWMKEGTFEGTEDGTG